MGSRRELLFSIFDSHGILLIVSSINVKKNTFYIADYLHLPGLNFGAIFSGPVLYVIGLQGNVMHMKNTAYKCMIMETDLKRRCVPHKWPAWFDPWTDLKLERKSGFFCKGPFPLSYKSVVQPDVQASVLPVLYKSIVHLPCTAGSPTLSETERVGPKRSLKVRFHGRTFVPYCLPYRLHFCPRYTVYMWHTSGVWRFHADLDVQHTKQVQVTEKMTLKFKLGKCKKSAM
jgi:hypothetical protein